LANIEDLHNISLIGVFTLRILPVKHAAKTTHLPPSRAGTGLAG